jgi:hypothetical protein
LNLLNPPPSSNTLQPPPATADEQYYLELFDIPDKTTQVAKDIYKMPEVRDMKFRPGKKLANLDNPKIAANLEAAYGQTRGYLAPIPCVNCTKKNPKGPWQECVQVQGKFDRACCNCRYNNGGRACTLHRLNAAPKDLAPPKSASAKPQPSKPRTPSKWSNKAKRLMKGEGEREEEGEDEDEEDNGDGDISSVIGDDSEDDDSEEGVPRNPWDLPYGPRKLKGG